MKLLTVVKSEKSDEKILKKLPSLRALWILRLSSLPLIAVASAMTLRVALIYTKSLKAKIVRVFRGTLKYYLI